MNYLEYTLFCLFIGAGLGGFGIFIGGFRGWISGMFIATAVIIYINKEIR